MKENNNQPFNMHSSSGKVALAIKFGRASDEGLYLPVQATYLKPGQAAIFSETFLRPEKHSLESLRERERYLTDTGQLDGLAKFEDDLIIRLRDGSHAPVKTSPGGRVSYRYLYDEGTDTALYGVVGPSEEVVTEAAKDWQRSLPRIK